MTLVPDVLRDVGFCFKLLEMFLVCLDTYFVKGMYLFLGEPVQGHPTQKVALDFQPSDVTALFQKEFDLMMLLHIAMPSYIVILGTIIIVYIMDDSGYLQELIFVAVGGCLNLLGGILVLCATDGTAGYWTSTHEPEKTGRHYTTNQIVLASMAFVTAFVMLWDTCCLCKINRKISL